MKIVHLIFAFNTGGSETMLVDIANEQVKQAEVSVIIINKTYNKILLNKIDKKVKIYFINRIESSKNPFPVYKLNILLLKLEATVLHCHNHNIIPLILPWLKKKAFLTLHCIGIPSKYLTQYHRLFAISESVKKDVASRTKITSVVVYNGISTKKISIKQDYTINDNFKIIEVGRLDHSIKGQHLAIKALHLLKEKGISNIQLDLIGEGNSEPYLRELVEKYDLSNQVNFLGLKDREYIYSHLMDYDLLIQPSLFEGFGLTVAEGMAAKLPILVSDIDGPMEIIEQGKFGFHFRSGDPKKIVEQILYLTSHYKSKELELKVEESYKHAIEYFDIKKTAMNYIKNY